MKTFYIRFGRKFVIPSTVQIKHEIMRTVLTDPPMTARPAEPGMGPPTSIT